MIRVLAPAKINPFLAVGARRADGFHEIESVMQSVGMYDEVHISALDAGLRFDVLPEGSAPEDESNLVVRAVRALWQATGRTPGAEITLHKRIPVAAGLAGGSSDAAAALVGLNGLWDAGLSRKALEKIGAALGSDVPFCVRGGTCAVRGRGEALSPLPVRGPLWWVLAMPAGSLSTAEVYAEFDRLTPSPALEDPFPLVDALARGDLDAIAEFMRNDLEQAALSLAPSIEYARGALEDAGAVGVAMSGSGPSWMALCRDQSHAERVAEAVTGAFEQVAVAPSLDHGPRPTTT